MPIFAPLNSEPVPLLQQIEVATFFQLPSFQIIGLPSPEVTEARERIRSAIEASGFEFPRKRVVLNLSPASIRKRGTGLDLAMALAVLGVDQPSRRRVAAWAELGLDGILKPAGQLTRTIFAAWQGQVSHLLVSQAEYSLALQAFQCVRNGAEVPGTPPLLVPVRTLLEAWNFTSTDFIEFSVLENFDEGPMRGAESTSPPPHPSLSLLPLSPALERMVGISVAGHHHFLLLGPRGTGKSHALEWLTHLYPGLSPFDHFQRQMVSEIWQNKTQQALSSVRRVSAQVKAGALTGGATAWAIRPGEYSLAHGGLLLADELPEWSRDSRESLREPLERGKVTITRAQGSFELPAQFLLAANGNLCPCGGIPPGLSSSVPPGVASYDSEKGKKEYQKNLLCRCSHSMRRNYLGKLSGPILDRMDLVAMLLTPAANEKRESASSEVELRKRIEFTRQSLEKRWGKLSGLLSGGEIESILERHSDGLDALSRLQYSSLRSRHKIVRVALSLAAWDGESVPSPAHFMEAFCYRAERFSLLT